MLKYIINFTWLIAMVLLLFGGIYFSFKLGFPQLRLIKIFKSFKSNSNANVSIFSGLTMSLAARIGVGSLAGIALAIYIGGPGTIFWIWIVGIITSINSYCESYLGAKYQKKDDFGYKGGPAFYINSGLKSKGLAFLYAIIVIVAYIVGFITIQSNTITIAMNKYYDLNPVFLGGILAIISLISIMKGVNSIVKITNKLVPIMGIGYIVLSLFVIIVNIDKLPRIFLNIVTSAFDFKAFGSGIFSTFIIGLQRGVFSTEAGLGTGAIASSCTEANDKVPLALTQIIGIYFTVFIVCTSTALIILTSDYSNFTLTNINGIELTQYAMDFHFDRLGNIVLLLMIISLAYSTIIAGYYYGESNLKYLCVNAKKECIVVLKIVTTLLIFLGSILTPTFLWKSVDIFVALLAIINMYVLLKLRKEIINDYTKK